MLLRLLRNLRYRNWKPAATAISWQADLPPRGASFFGVDRGVFYIPTRNHKGLFMPDGWPTHSMLMEEMEVPARGYTAGLSFLFERGFVRAFYHKDEHDSGSFAKVPDYLFLEAAKKEYITAVCDRIVTSVPFLMVQWDVTDDPHKYTIPSNHGSDLVRTLASRKPTYVALLRARAINENWPDPERA